MSGDEVEDPVESPMSPGRLTRPTAPRSRSGSRSSASAHRPAGSRPSRSCSGSLPAAPGMAFVLVQHLDPKHDSILPELLAASTPMPVLRRRGRACGLQPDHVYVIPPNAIVTVADAHSEAAAAARTSRGRSCRSTTCSARWPTTLGRRAIGVILSGGGTDGSLGMQAIKEADGITFAQDEAQRGA